MELLVLWSLMGLVGFVIGNVKGRALFGFCLGILLGPIGWILVLCFGNAGAECQMCRKAIDPLAKICPYCRSAVVAERKPDALPFIKADSFRKTITPTNRQ